jgi:hypothetical protein
MPSISFRHFRDAYVLGTAKSSTRREGTANCREREEYTRARIESRYGYLNQKGNQQTKKSHTTKLLPNQPIGLFCMSCCLFCSALPVPLCAACPAPAALLGSLLSRPPCLLSAHLVHFTYGPSRLLYLLHPVFVFLPFLVCLSCCLAGIAARAKCAHFAHLRLEPITYAKCVGIPGDSRLNYLTTIYATYIM